MHDFNNYSVFEDHENLFIVKDVESAMQKLKKGKSAGLDKLTTEHLIYAHPSVIVSLKLLFNMMLVYGLVPDDFGKGLLIPLVKDSKGDVSQCENYRGITVSCVISKLFEYVMLGKYSSLFKTDSLQFGFQNGVGCSDALFTVKSVVDHYTKNGCTVSVSALDISKAFDRVSLYALFSKLMERKFPKQVILVLLSWYKNNYTKVKWKDSFSDFFQPLAGVRQGGILSPFLFALYIEDILLQLKLKDKGCKIGKVYLGCFLYADDILLLSQSMVCMQSILNICCDVSKFLDLKFNVKKSATLRIGKRCNTKCCRLMLDGIEIPFADEIKYLGIIIKKDVKFCRSYCSTKINFYRCFNAVYSKASFANEDVLINLFRAYCIPIITYACEAVYPSSSDMKSIDKLISTAFSKIFHSFDIDLITNARLCFGLHSIAEMLLTRQQKFLSRYYNKSFTFSSTIYYVNHDYFF